MKYEEYIKPSEACQCILDFINSEDFYKAVAPENRGAVMSGLGLAGTVIHARCPRYLAKLTLDEDEEEK